MRTQGSTSSSPSPDSRDGEIVRRTLAQLAEIARGEAVGDAAASVTGVADLDNAGATDVSYCVSKAYLEAAGRSLAGILVVPRDTPDLGRPMIRVANPYFAFSKILEVYAPRAPRRDPAVSPLAHVAPTARLGAGVVVRPFAVVDEHAVVGDRTVLESGVHVGAGARIGADCLLHPHVAVLARCQLGDRVVIQANAVIGSDGFGYAFDAGRHHKIPQIGIVVIEDDVEIGASTTIDRATMGRTAIGRGSKIDNLVQIGHNCELGPDCAIVAQVGISGSTKIGAGVRMAGQTGTVGHVAIGDHCTIAARGVVTKDLPAKSFVSGFPARPHGEEKRIQVAMARLPELLKRLRALESKLGVKVDGGRTDAA